MVANSRWSNIRATLLQLSAELSWVFIAVLLAMRLDGHLTHPLVPESPQALMFAVLIVSLNGALGLYRRPQRLPFHARTSRMFLALLIGAPIAYFAAPLLPGGNPLHQDTIGLAAVLALSGLVVVRYVVVEPLVEVLLPHRVLVLGTGVEARDVEASIASASAPGLLIVGFYALDKVRESMVAPDRILKQAESLPALVRRLGVREIIVAVREQRGGVLSLRDLLDCRLRGVQVTNLARFFERVHGRVPIETLKASWLIYGEGFRQNRLRRLTKRTFDVVVAALLLVLMLPVMAVVALAIALESGLPIIYRQERTGFGGKPFTVLKFRSMTKDAEKDGNPRWATPKDTRVTGLGRFLRLCRIDELPQLLNVLRGEMSFVGPRPERPAFVSMLTERIPFYAVRHSVKPGLTGWAQVRYSYGANVEQSVKKLEYDLYYVKNNTLLLDLRILFETVRVVLLAKGAC
jgi:sugar transferase (PEP-CTERM system associated)